MQRRRRRKGRARRLHLRRLLGCGRLLSFARRHLTGSSSLLRLTQASTCLWGQKNSRDEDKVASLRRHFDSSRAAVERAEATPTIKTADPSHAAARHPGNGLKVSLPSAFATTLRLRHVDRAAHSLQPHRVRAACPRVAGARGLRARGGGAHSRRRAPPRPRPLGAWAHARAAPTRRRSHYVLRSLRGTPSRSPVSNCLLSRLLTDASLPKADGTPPAVRLLPDLLGHLLELVERENARAQLKATNPLAAAVDAALLAAQRGGGGAAPRLPPLVALRTADGTWATVGKEGERAVAATPRDGPAPPPPSDPCASPEAQPPAAARRPPSADEAGAGVGSPRRKAVAPRKRPAPSGGGAPRPPPTRRRACAASGGAAGGGGSGGGHDARDDGGARPPPPPFSGDLDSPLTADELALLLGNESLMAFGERVAAALPPLQPHAHHGAASADGSGGGDDGGGGGCGWGNDADIYAICDELGGDPAVAAVLQPIISHAQAHAQQLQQQEEEEEEEEVAAEETQEVGAASAEPCDGRRRRAAEPAAAAPQPQPQPQPLSQVSGGGCWREAGGGGDRENKGGAQRGGGDGCGGRIHTPPQAPPQPPQPPPDPVPLPQPLPEAEAETAAAPEALPTPQQPHAQQPQAPPPPMPLPGELPPPLPEGVDMDDFLSTLEYS